MVSHAHGQAMPIFHFVIPELVDKVEFNKGPYLAEKAILLQQDGLTWKDETRLVTVKKKKKKAEREQFDTYRIFGG